MARDARERARACDPGAGRLAGGARTTRTSEFIQSACRRRPVKRAARVTCLPVAPRRQLCVTGVLSLRTGLVFSVVRPTFAPPPPGHVAVPMAVHRRRADPGDRHRPGPLRPKSDAHGIHVQRVQPLSGKREL